MEIRVRGRVQGVWFRKSAKQQAVALGLYGMVRNERDGSVYIEAEGDPYALEVFIAWCKEGPDAAEVEAVSVAERPPIGYTSFMITH